MSIPRARGLRIVRDLLIFQ